MFISLFKTVSFNVLKHISKSIPCITSPTLKKYHNFCPKTGYMFVLKHFSKKRLRQKIIKNR